MPHPVSFSEIIVRWQKQHGRHNLPWQKTRDPYRIWLSEIMLQQTQVKTVIPYYLRFLDRFPDLERLAHAPEDTVLGLWSGLGYYSRARNLHAAARIIFRGRGGRFPDRFEDLLELPGVGRSTAGAISVFAFGGRQPILDGNVRRVFNRFFGLKQRKAGLSDENALWAQAQSLLPGRDIRAYTQGLMDLGATVCTMRTPACEKCPLGRDCRGRAGLGTGIKPRNSAVHKATHLHIRWLVLRMESGMLLEKRNGPGIWRGLYSFPELPVGLSPMTYCKKQWGLRVRKVRPLAPFSHALTHRTLLLHPFLLDVPRGPCPRQLKAFDASGVRTGALSAPVKKLLLALLPPKATPRLSKGKQLI